MSNQKNQKLEKSHLVTNLINNKDAVVIIGDKCIPDILKINESTKEHFNRRLMVKSPGDFWKWYNENIYKSSQEISETEKAINSLLETGLFKMAINLNYTDHIDKDITNIIELRGNKKILRCMSCNKTYDIPDENGVVTFNGVLKCSCNGKIAPTVTMFGEKYRQPELDTIKQAIFKETEDGVKLNTHNLIFIGVDFEEDYMHELMESYNAIKATMPEDEAYYTIMVCEKDGVSIEYYKPEFATYEDITASINRLIDNIEGAES